MVSQTHGDQAAVQHLVDSGKVEQTSSGYMYAGKLYTNAPLLWMAFQAANISLFESIKNETKKQEGFQAAPQGIEWTDQGVSQQESKPSILSTPIQETPL